ncbi:MAG: hypoxanthine phosphoribosyltransferase [Candidatus Adiutrix sp.]|jgi:hypoxanthine phosphoribosyltransferase|nr:hypoxanthine phosphoribosyltransferase [Candidatus Adiutrix sp.]
MSKRLVLTRAEIEARVAGLGRRISQDYEKVLPTGEALLAGGVLNGAFIFMADLVRALGDLPVEVDFVRLSSYQNSDVSSAKVVMTKTLEKEIRDRHVLVVEDIADCGLTLAWLLDFLGRRRPASLKVAVAVDKKARREVQVPLDYVAMEAEGFLVGYGLDYAEKYRQLPDIYELDTQPGAPPLV